MLIDLSNEERELIREAIVAHAAIGTVSDKAPRMSSDNNRKMQRLYLKLGGTLDQQIARILGLVQKVNGGE